VWRSFKKTRIQNSVWIDWVEEKGVQLPCVYLAWFPTWESPCIYLSKHTWNRFKLTCDWTLRSSLYVASRSASICARIRIHTIWSLFSYKWIHKIKNLLPTIYSYTALDISSPLRAPVCVHRADDAAPGRQNQPQPACAEPKSYSNHMQSRDLQAGRRIRGIKDTYNIYIYILLYYIYIYLYRQTNRIIRLDDSPLTTNRQYAQPGQFHHWWTQDVRLRAQLPPAGSPPLP
jgi:hypothetical protein